MARYFALRDRRLEGGVPSRANLSIFNTSESTPLANAFASINGVAAGAGGKIHSMFVLCHGYAGENTSAGMSMDAGGMGLELGREDVTHTNVAMWSAIAARWTTSSFIHAEPVIRSPMKARPQTADT